jgi:hypothetical protein
VELGVMRVLGEGKNASKNRVKEEIYVVVLVVVRGRVDKETFYAGMNELRHGRGFQNETAVDEEVGEAVQGVRFGAGFSEVRTCSGGGTLGADG